MPFFTPSNWNKVSGNSGTISVGPELLGKFTVDVTHGCIGVKRDSEQAVTTLGYNAAGFTLGGGIVPSLGNFSMDMPSRPSSDRIYKTSRAGAGLEINELKGDFIILSVGMDLTVGYSMSGMYIGGRNFLDISLPGFLGLEAARIAANIAFFIRTSKSYIPMSGPTLTMIPANIGASLTRGRIY